MIPIICIKVYILSNIIVTYEGSNFNASPFWSIPYIKGKLFKFISGGLFLYIEFVTIVYDEYDIIFEKYVIIIDNKREKDNNEKNNPHGVE